MDKERFDALVKDAFAGVDNQTHLPAEDVTVPIMDAPIYGFAAADDPIFELFRDPAVIGEKFMAPKEWMPEAKRRRSAAGTGFPRSPWTRRG